jgi:chloramphenicol O-acetyltransferase type A
LSRREPEILDLASWKRRQHFEFFRHYEKPWFNICADVDVTALLAAQVVVHPVIHGGSTVLMPDGTFAFAYFDYQTGFHAFATEGARELERVRNGPAGLRPEPKRDDMIHYSVIPWVAFSSFSHARVRTRDVSVPKIVFGKHRRVGDRSLLPVSVEVHHALVDGLHVGRFYQRFEESAGRPELLD